MSFRAALRVFGALLPLSSPSYAAELHSNGSSTTFSLAPVRYAVEPRQRLGDKKAGLLCFPNGSLSFRDLTLPSPEELTRDVSHKLVLAGLNVAAPDPAGFGNDGAAYRIVATVVNIDLSVCAKRWGLGDGSTVRGRAVVTIDWAVYGRQSRERLASATSHGNHMTGPDSIDISDLVSKAIVDAAGRVAETPQGREFVQFQ
jgi:hypothetical protein